MNTAMIIETVGYVGSALVLISMLMTSVVRLRIINLTGSVIFSVYALMIRSYPTAVMNICLAGINIYHIIRVFRQQKIYNMIKTDMSDGFFSYMLKKCDEDIKIWFPEFSADNIKADIACLVCCESNPACLFLGKETKSGELEVLLDYATPVYRDTSVGRFLYRALAKDGYSSLVFRQNAEKHIPYLRKIGYEDKEDNSFVLDLKALKY